MRRSELIADKCHRKFLDITAGAVRLAGVRAVVPRCAAAVERRRGAECRRARFPPPQEQAPSHWLPAAAVPSRPTSRAGYLKFAGELFNNDMIDFTILDMSLSTLLDRIQACPASAWARATIALQNAIEEDEVESVVRLLQTTGKRLADSDPVARAQFPLCVYIAQTNVVERSFQQLADTASQPTLPSRIKFMIEDLVIFRGNGHARDGRSAPSPAAAGPRRPSPKARSPRPSAVRTFLSAARVHRPQRRPCRRQSRRVRVRRCACESRRRTRIHWCADHVDGASCPRRHAKGPARPAAAAAGPAHALHQASKRACATLLIGSRAARPESESDSVPATPTNTACTRTGPPPLMCAGGGAAVAGGGNAADCRHYAGVLRHQRHQGSPHLPRRGGTPALGLSRPTLHSALHSLLALTAGRRGCSWRPRWTAC